MTNNKPQVTVSLDSWLSTQQWFSVQELRLFFFGMVLSILAKGISAFALAYAVDDILWINFPFEGSILREVALGDGRFLYPVLVEFFYQLGIDAPKAYTLSAFCMMASLVLSAQLTCRLWRVEKEWLISLIVIALVTLHPYQADIFTWKISMLTGGIPFVLTMLGLWFSVSLPRYGLGLGVLAITASLAVHQLAITFAAVAVCFSVILVTVQTSKPLREVWLERKLNQQFLALGLALGCYLVVASLVRFVWPPIAAFDRAKILNNLDSIAPSDNISNLLDLLFFHNSLFTPLADWGLALLAGIFTIVLIGRIVKSQWCINYKLLAIALVVVALVSAWVASMGLAILSQKGPILVRSMMAFSVMWAGIATVTLSIGQGDKVYYRLIVGIIFLISFAFVATNNQVLSDQLRANQRDIEFANRIVSNLEQLDGFHHVVNVAVIGINNQSLNGLRTGLDMSSPKQSNLGVVTSVFTRTYSNVYRIQLLNEATGYRFGSTPTPEENKTAELYCKYARDYIGLFPTKGSIVIDKELGIVCL